MPRRSILSAAERENLRALPDTKDDLIRYYTFSETDLSLIRQRRGPANRLGFAVQLCYLRFPGIILGIDQLPFPPLLKLVADQLKVNVDIWDDYGQREQTRREHLAELQTVFGFQSFTMSHYRQAVHTLTELAIQTDKGILLVSALIEHLRRQLVILPAINAIERASGEAITRANRRIYETLSEPLANTHRHRLDDLLKRRDNGKTTWLAWLRQSPVKPNSRHMLEHIERLKAWQALDLPAGIERLVHQNRLLKIAREGGQMTPADLAKFEPQRRYATLVALTIEGMATVIDEIIDLHDRILGKLFNAAKNKHQQHFQASGKAINSKIRLYGRIGQALLEAKKSGGDPFAAIETVMSWDAFAESVTEAQKLAQPEDFDFLHRIGESYATLRRYAPEFLDVLKLRAAPAAKDVLEGIEVLRGMNADNARKVPVDAPTGFIKKRWEKLVMTDAGIDRRYYELCALSELKNALRSGDIWVQGSRQFKDFEDYLVPPEKFASLKQASELPLAVATDCDKYLHDRLTLLETQLATVNRMALANDLPDAIITESGLKITPLDAAVPDTAQALIDKTAMALPHIKITELLLEVDEWTGFTQHFAHLKSGDLAKDKHLLLSTILADAIVKLVVDPHSARVIGVESDAGESQGQATALDLMANLKRVRRKPEPSSDDDGLDVTASTPRRGPGGPGGIGPNVVLRGPNGVGKSMLARNVAHQALVQGHTVRFTTAGELLGDLAALDSDAALRRRLRHYAAPDLLVIDEIGYLSYSNRHADLLFELVSRRYESKSTMVTTNKAFGEWNTVFPNAACVVCLIDRLVHHSELIDIRWRVAPIEGGQGACRATRLQTQKGQAMKHLHLPSGLHRGIGLLIDKEWTTEQAQAVVELLDDLREVIVRHYHPQIVEFMRQNRSTKFDSCVDQYGQGEPF